MADLQNPLQDFWEEILSGESVRVRKAFDDLEPDTQEAVLRHLKRMAEEAGWHPLQQASARAALQSLDRLDK